MRIKNYVKLNAVSKKKNEEGILMNTVSACFNDVINLMDNVVEFS